MRADVLAEAMGNAVTDQRYAQLVGPFTAAMADAGCNTVERAAMWCAQLGHESMGLRYMEEIASGEAYEGRADLGNTVTGDGKRYKGRGPIQVTGRANYAACSKWAAGRKLVASPTFFVDQPAALATDQFGFVGAVWYWVAARPQLNRISDARDVTGATRAINGGTNGLDARTVRYRRCLALGAALLEGAPTSSTPSTSTPEGDWFDMATADDLRNILREVCGTPAQRGDIGWMRDQIAAVLRFDSKLTPEQLAADPASADLARQSDIGYLMTQLSANAGTGGTDEPASVAPDVEALADMVADRLFARVVAHGGLPAS